MFTFTFSEGEETPTNIGYQTLCKGAWKTRLEVCRHTKRRKGRSEGKGRDEGREEGREKGRAEGGKGRSASHREPPEVAVSSTGVTKRVAAARSKPSNAAPVLAHALSPAWGLTLH